MFLSKFINKSKVELTELRKELYVQQQRNEALDRINDLLKKELIQANDCISLYKNKISKLSKNDKVIDVVLDVLKNAEKHLSTREVMNRMDKRRLKNKNPTFGSVSNSIKCLVKTGDVKVGKKARYCLKNSPWDTQNQ